jgi:hypothetical protein
MLHRKPGTEYHESVARGVRFRELIFRVGGFLVVQATDAADCRQQRKHALPAYTSAENGDGALEQHGNFVWRRRNHEKE